MSFVTERGFFWQLVWNFGRLSWFFLLAVKMLLQSNGQTCSRNSIFYLFSISRLLVKSYGPKNLLSRRGRAYKILSEIWEAHGYDVT